MQDNSIDTFFDDRKRTTIEQSGHNILYSQDLFLRKTMDRNINFEIFM